MSTTLKLKLAGLLTAVALLMLSAALVPASASADTGGSVGVIDNSGAWLRSLSGGGWQLQVAPGDQPKDVSVGGGYVGMITSSGAYIRSLSSGGWQQQATSTDQPTDISVGDGYVGMITSSGAYIRSLSSGGWQQQATSTDQPTDISVGDGYVGMITSSGAYIRSLSSGGWQQQATSTDQPTDISVGDGYVGMITSSGAYIRSLSSGGWQQQATSTEKPTDISVGDGYVGMITSSGAYIRSLSSGGWQQQATSTDQPTDISVGDSSLVSRAWGQALSSNPGQPYGQCTYWAEQEFQAYTGKYFDVMGPESGGAYTYGDDAAAHGWTVTTQPEVDSVVVFPRGVDGASSKHGHVAWVTGVSGSTITVTQMDVPIGNSTETTETYTVKAGMQFILAP